MTEHIFCKGVIVGVKFHSERDKFTVRLPDKYFGEGNDIADAILRILVVRELSKRNPKLPPYLGDSDIEASRWMIGYMYGFEPPHSFFS